MKKIVLEYERTQTIADPLDEHKATINNCPKNNHLTIEEEVFLLALRAEDATRTNLEYIHLLAENYGKTVSSSFISKWFKRRFEFPADFKKPNVVPLDKW